MLAIFKAATVIGCRFFLPGTVCKFAAHPTNCRFWNTSFDLVAFRAMLLVFSPRLTVFQLNPFSIRTSFRVMIDLTMLQRIFRRICMIWVCVCLRHKCFPIRQYGRFSQIFHKGGHALLKPCVTGRAQRAAGGRPKFFADELCARQSGGFYGRTSGFWRLCPAP
jgi:hypothetical protein